MKTQIMILTTVLVLGNLPARAVTTIDPANPHAYGANVGWINAEGDVANGAVMGQAFCSGHLYSANCGWISLGDESPDNGIAYANDSATDFGVNHDGQGNLTGYAYGANIGWINFEQTHGQPKVDLLTGELSGYAWGANVGWIHLRDVYTLVLAAPDTDGDGIPDAWELGHTNTLLVLSNGETDSDGDGVPDVDEYGADTDPFEAGDYLVITDFQTLETTHEVTWPVKMTRQYTLQHAAALSNATAWAETSSAFIPASGPDVTETVTSVTNAVRFYRVIASPPLAP